MADGGASSFIFLTTALLVSGLVSVVLINQWGEMAQISSQETASLEVEEDTSCLLYTSPSPRDGTSSRMPSSA